MTLYSGTSICTYQCCIVWAISDAWIKCSMTMVAFRLTRSRPVSIHTLALSEKALSHRALRRPFSSLSTISVAKTELTTKCRNRFCSSSDTQIVLRSARKFTSISRSHAESTEFCAKAGDRLAHEKVKKTDGFTKYTGQGRA